MPDVVLDGEARYGRAGWGDAATIVPWAVYEAYGDSIVLHDQFESMRKAVDSYGAVRKQTASSAPLCSLAIGSTRMRRRKDPGRPRRTLTFWQTVLPESARWSLTQPSLLGKD